MHVRCSYCSQSFNLAREYVAQAVAKAEGKKRTYHGVECINCRKLIKVPLKQMRAFLPKEDADSGA